MSITRISIPLSSFRTLTWVQFIRELNRIPKANTSRKQAVTPSQNLLQLPVVEEAADDHQRNRRQTGSRIAKEVRPGSAPHPSFHVLNHGFHLSAIRLCCARIRRPREKRPPEFLVTHDRDPNSARSAFFAW